MMEENKKNEEGIYNISSFPQNNENNSYHTVSNEIAFSNDFSDQINVNEMDIRNGETQLQYNTNPFTNEEIPPQYNTNSFTNEETQPQYNTNSFTNGETQPQYNTNSFTNGETQPQYNTNPFTNGAYSIPMDDEKRQRFKYQVLNDQGLKETSYIDAPSKEDLKNYLENEGYQVVSIKAQNNLLHASIGGTKMKYSDLSFVLTQLSTYLKAGIPLIDSVKILQKQSVKLDQKRIFSNITYELVRGESFSHALERQGSTFPKLLINMVKTAELTGDLPSILDDMTEYYTSIDRTRKQVVSAMTYPIIIFIFALVVITFILLYIVPEFVSLFEQNNAEIPALTRFVINASNFLTHNALYVIGGILIFLTIYVVCYKKVRSFRKMMQSLFMHLPIIGNVMIYKEVSMFTKTFASLLNHDVFITDSMAILSTISNNEIYREIIQDSLDYLSRGAKISDSFKGKWAFPIVAYEMLVTGENTGRLPMMMNYVASYYEDLHSNYIKRLNTFIEPIMILFLAVIVGVVVLSVIIPMFSFYSQISY